MLLRPERSEGLPFLCVASHRDNRSSEVFLAKVVLNNGIFQRNLAWLVLGHSRRDYITRFQNSPPGGRVYLVNGPENHRFCRFQATRGQIWPLGIKYQKILFKIGFFCVFWVGVIFGLWRPKNAKNLIPWTRKSFLLPFSGHQRPNMTSWHKIPKNSFQNRFFCVFWMGVIFGLWRPQSAKNLIPWSRKSFVWTWK